MKRINLDEFKVVNKIELSNIPNELIIDAKDDQKKDELLKFQQKSVSKINFNIYL